MTYDWLEDVLMDKKVWTHYNAYHPGRPRDIEAINAGRRKVKKKSLSNKGGKAHGSLTTDSQDTVENNEGHEERSSNLVTCGKSNATEPRPDDRVQVSQGTGPQGGHQMPGHHTQEPAKSPKGENREVVTHDINFHVELMSQQLLQKRRLGPDDPIFAMVPADKQTPSSKVSTITETKKQGQVAPAPKMVKKRIAHGSSNDVLWEVKAKPRIFLENKFHYRVELTRKEDDHKWVLNLFESTSALMPKSYKYCARRYDREGKTLLVDSRDPVPSLRTALKYFSEGFRGKTGYSWDERLLRSGLPQPQWRYRAPPAGKATGRVPPEYTPGDPKCVKAEDLKLIDLSSMNSTKKKQSLNEASDQRPPKNDKTAQWQKLVAQEKANNSSQKKRKADNSPPSETQTKINKSVLSATQKRAGGLGGISEGLRKALKVNTDSTEEGTLMSTK